MQQEGLALAKRVAKRGGNFAEMEATTQALTALDKSKTGGKLWSNLMKKRNACKIVISTDDRVKHHKWMEQRVKLEKERDEKMEKKKAL